MTTYKADDIIKCPYCDEDQEGTAEEHTIPVNRTVASQTECHACDRVFTVRKKGDDYIVEKP